VARISRSHTVLTRTTRSEEAGVQFPVSESSFVYFLLRSGFAVYVCLSWRELSFCRRRMVVRDGRARGRVGSCMFPTLDRQVTRRLRYIAIKELLHLFFFFFLATLWKVKSFWPSFSYMLVLNVRCAVVW
jgi:hypothetical protein